MFPYSLSPIHHIKCFFFRFVLYYKRFKISYMIKPVLKILYTYLFFFLFLCAAEDFLDGPIPVSISRTLIPYFIPFLFLLHLQQKVSITNSRLTTDMTRKSAMPCRGNPGGLIPAPPFYYLQTIWTSSDV